MSIALPLPSGNNAAETIRRLRVIDAEIFGSIYARAGTLGSLTVTGTLTGGTLVGSDIYSANWDGAAPANLATPDTTATAGYYLDASVGSMQLAGNLWLASNNATIHVGDPDSGAVVQIGIGGTTGGLGWESTFPSPLEAPSVRGPFFLVNIDGDFGGAYPADSSQYVELVSAQWTGNDEVWMRLTADNWTTGTNPYFQIGIGARANGIFAVKLDGVYIDQPLIALAGTAAAPSYTISGDTSTGIFGLAAGQLGFTSGGNLAFAMLRTGDSNRLVFGNSVNDYLNFDDVLNRLTFVINGNTEFRVDATTTRSLNVYNTTTASAANVYVNSSGTLMRSTSTEENKRSIKPWKRSGSVLDVTPVTFYYLEGNAPKGQEMKRSRNKLLGLTYENVKKHFPKGVTSDKSLDWNAITTALLVEVKELNERVAELENTK